MRRARGFVVTSCALALGLALAGCPREKRDFRELPALDARPLPVRQTTLQPGAGLPSQTPAAPTKGTPTHDLRGGAALRSTTAPAATSTAAAASVRR